MMTLYHGSNVLIDYIDLSMSKPNKDFGKGFYLTDIREQALEMAYRRCRFLGQGEPVVTSFSFDEALLENNILKIKRFETPSEEWAYFILKNRHANVNNFRHDFDIVIGPVADDGVAFQLGRYERGLITLQTLAEELRYKKLNRQYFFGTERAIHYLIRL